MTINDLVNSIYRRTKTNSISFTAANMLIAINSAQNRVNSIIRRHIDNYRPTDFTSSDVTTGIRVPILDAEFHELISLWASWEYAIENGLPSASGFMGQIQLLEKELILFYGSRNYQVFTVTIASPGVITKNNHRLNTDDKVSFITTGALPTGLSADTYYFVIYGTADTFTVSATKGGTAINTSGSQSGTHYYFSDKKGGFYPSGDSNK